MIRHWGFQVVISSLNELINLLIIIILNIKNLKIAWFGDNKLFWGNDIFTDEPKILGVVDNRGMMREGFTVLNSPLEKSEIFHSECALQVCL